MGVKMIMLLIVAGGKAQDGLRNNSANFFKRFITRRWVSGQVHDGDFSNPCPQPLYKTAGCVLEATRFLEPALHRILWHFDYQPVSLRRKGLCHVAFGLFGSITSE